MSPESIGNHSIWTLITSGGMSMYPLLICSIVVWGVIMERLWVYRKLGHELRAFHLEAMNLLLRGDREGIRSFCRAHPTLPTSQLLIVALDRISATDPKIRNRWMEALEPRR